MHQSLTMPNLRNCVCEVVDKSWNSDSKFHIYVKVIPLFLMGHAPILAYYGILSEKTSRQPLELPQYCHNNNNNNKLAFNHKFYLIFSFKWYIKKLKSGQKIFILKYASKVPQIYPEFSTEISFQVINSA